jgi:Rrf2 family iron-sulfur cluster assembly transcriptional regulator
MLTTKGRYAVMAMIEVASADADLPLKLANISIKQDIPQNYLEQIFQKLKKAGLVKSVKGPGGGYMLNVNKENIAIINIIDAVEENIKMTRCSVNKNCVKNGVKCKTHHLWKGLGNQIRSYFTSISVADVMNDKINLTG